MKKIFTLIAFLAVSMIMTAQSLMYITKTNGTQTIIPVKDVKDVTFKEFIPLNTEVQLDYKNTPAKVEISPYGSGTASSDASWCAVSPARISTSTKELTITAEDNFSSDTRVAHVTATVSGNIIADITVVQAGMNESDTDAPEGMESNAIGLVKKINVGWNLGNTLEATDEWTDQAGVTHSNSMYKEGGANLFTETSWQSAKTTKAMFTALKNAGFNAIRVPVRWYRHADKDMNINKDWMARVKEIVDYAISQDMYVILNSHHDNWYDRLRSGYDEEAIHAKFQNMWTQIATEFRGYDEHLIFAGANEIISINSDGSENWGNPTSTHFQFINKLMQLFVNTVRATGGRNSWRCLMVEPWACNPSFAIDSKFTLPTDTKENRLIVEYHCYDPYNYAIGKGQKDNKWAEHEPQQSELNAVKSTIDKLNTRFISKGVPCLMAEFGSTQDNTHPDGNTVADKIRADYHQFIVSNTKAYNIAGFYWDNYCFETTGENFGLLDRKNSNFPTRAQIALKGIMDGLK